MIDVVSKTTLRGKRISERREMMNAAKPKGVRVNPANDDMRRVLKHPTSGAFPKSGGADWPNDRFTKRRIADGTIKLEQAKKQAAPTPAAQPKPEAAPPAAPQQKPEAAPPPQTNSNPQPPPQQQPQPTKPAT